MDDFNRRLAALKADGANKAPQSQEPDLQDRLKKLKGTNDDVTEEELTARLQTLQGQSAPQDKNIKKTQIKSSEDQLMEQMADEIKLDKKTSQQKFLTTLMNILYHPQANYIMNCSFIEMTNIYKIKKKKV
ncbi:hypothetical protein RFI_19478 [Reticulomyxa filosa]|uniref:Uncharacterized protein n=1 Tax=Reticulomyxa filosa TaxID=46433 RepID=X6MV12_RETFI|nr:hypothetical protein RFI_19478 [Reticulomyxa filosa]|eukprot:ETO17833.1 hypothetical protein RFI_19478 [Reticulomyxa filosa]